MINRRALLALFATVPFTPAIAADGPDAVVAGIYKRIVATYAPAKSNTINGYFTWTKKNRHQYYSASLAKAWDHADAITAKGDQNPPGSDPITNSQDPLVAAYDVKIEKQDRKTATVIVHIADKPGPVTPTDRDTIAYDMVLERGRWRIDDIRPGLGEGKGTWSLRKEIVNHKG
jgi:hypothetical protein